MIKNFIFDFYKIERQGLDIELDDMTIKVINNLKRDFKEVKEGESIYYLAQVDYTNEEILRFEIEIQQSNQFQKLQFQQKFYVD